MADHELNRRLDRLGRVMEEHRGAVEQAELTRRERRELRKATRREERRSREMKEASYARGAVMLAIAAALAVLAILNQDKWWLIFVALGFGTDGAKQIDLVRRRAREPDLEGTSVVSPARDRADVLCDQLLAELKDSPAAVRDFLGKPEATVEAIRAACRQLDERRRLMLDAASPERMADLEQERKALEGRLGQLDPTTYRRATDALKVRQELFAQVRASTDKLESERQILLNTLESLRMRVVLAKGAGGTGAPLDAMKGEVERLASELAAITDALELSNRSELEAIAPIEPGDTVPSAPGVREKS